MADLELPLLKCTDLKDFIERAIASRMDYTGPNMYRFRAVDGTEWKLRLQPRGNRTDIKLYGPDSILFHSVPRIEEHFRVLEEEHVPAEEINDEPTVDTLKRVVAAVRIQIASRRRCLRKEAAKEILLMNEHDVQTQYIESVQAQVDSAKRELQEKQNILDEALRTRVQNLETTQATRHAIRARSEETVHAARLLTSCMEEIEWSELIPGKIDISDDLEFTTEEALQPSQETILSRAMIQSHIDAILAGPQNADTKGIITLARSIRVNPRQKYPLITHRLPLYLTPRRFQLSNGTNLVFARTSSGMSDEAKTIVKSRLNRGMVQDLVSSMSLTRTWWPSTCSSRMNVSV